LGSDAVLTLLARFSGVSIDTPSKKGYTALMKALAVAVPAPKSMLERKPFPAISAIPNNNVEELENANPPSDSVFDNGFRPTDQDGQRSTGRS
jgi:hypothetical protein